MKKASYLMLAIASALLLALAVRPEKGFGRDPNTEPNLPEKTKEYVCFLKTKWGQRDEYAKFSPQHRRLGCWSTALAQILYFHHLAPTGTVRYRCTKEKYLMEEDLGKYSFDWDLFVDEFSDKTSKACKDQVARYIYCVSIVVQKDFGTGSYVLKKHTQRADAIARHYGCKTKLYDNRKYSLEQIKQIIMQEINACRPLMMHLRTSSKDLSDEDYHAVAIDGYRMRKGEFWVHINVGHKGFDNGWYDFGRRILKYDDNNYRKILTIRPEPSGTKS